MIFDRLWVCLGLVLAPFLAPKLAPNRPKIGARRLLRPFFFKNVDFHADLRFPMFFHQNRPQDEAKIAPRSPQDGSKTVLKSFIFDVEICLRFWSVLGSVLVAFGVPFGSRRGALKTPETVKNARFREKSCLSKNKVSRGDLGRSWADLGSQKGPKWAPRRVKK